MTHTTPTPDGLPELPSSYADRGDSIGVLTQSIYIADQMRAYGLACIAQAAPAGDAEEVLQVYRGGYGWHDVGINEYIGTTSNNRRRLYAEPPAATERAATQPAGEVALDPVVEKVREALLARSQLGIKKYGDTLYNMNYSERDILQHAVEESMDLSNYLMARIMKLDAAPISEDAGEARHLPTHVSIKMHNELLKEFEKLETENEALKASVTPATPSGSTEQRAAIRSIADIDADIATGGGLGRTDRLLKERARAELASKLGAVGTAQVSAFRQHLADTAAKVATWPAYKQHALPLHQPAAQPAAASAYGLDFPLASRVGTGISGEVYTESQVRIWGASQREAGRQLGLEQHEAVQREIDAARNGLLQALEKERDDLRAQLAHWKSNHDQLAARCAILRERDDLPVDRLPAYRELVRLQEASPQLARPADLAGLTPVFWFDDGSTFSVRDNGLCSITVARYGARGKYNNPLYTAADVQAMLAGGA